MKIVPMRDLKDTVKIETMCSESHAPVFVTKNGYGKLVVMDMECFEKMMNDAYEAKVLRQGTRDMEDGKVIDGRKVLDDMKEKYGL